LRIIVHRYKAVNDMDTKRQQKYARLLQKELGEIFQRDTKSLFNGHFITVTTVRVSPDLGIAKVYLSFLLVEDKQKLLEYINEQAKTIRKMLGVKIRNQARIIPELHFYLDDNVEYASNIDQLFSKITIPPLDAEQTEKAEDET
jgi:ribosome-binding factor A